MEFTLLAISGVVAAVAITVQISKLYMRIIQLETKITNVVDSQKKITEYWLEYPEPEEIVQQAVKTNLSIASSPELQSAWENELNKTNQSNASIETKKAKAPDYTG